MIIIMKMHYNEKRLFRIDFNTLNLLEPLKSLCLVQKI